MFKEALKVYFGFVAIIFVFSIIANINSYEENVSVQKENKKIRIDY